MLRLSSKCSALLTTLLLISQLLAPAYATDKVIAGSLLSQLQGCWQGKALKTPRGPLPYPICFDKHEDNTLYGMAELSVSQHHWRFYNDEELSRLRFLSTFAGNQTPIELTAVSTATDRLVYTTPDSYYLQVSIQREGEGYLFTIEVKGKEHVLIQLLPLER